MAGPCLKTYSTVYNQYTLEQFIMYSSMCRGDLPRAETNAGVLTSQCIDRCALNITKNIYILHIQIYKTQKDRTVQKRIEPPRNFS